MAGRVDDSVDGVRPGGETSTGGDKLRPSTPSQDDSMDGAPSENPDRAAAEISCEEAPQESSLPSHRGLPEVPVPSPTKTLVEVSPVDTSIDELNDDEPDDDGPDETPATKPVCVSSDMPNDVSSHAAGNAAGDAPGEISANAILPIPTAAAVSSSQEAASTATASEAGEHAPDKPVGDQVGGAAGNGQGDGEVALDSGDINISPTGEQTPGGSSPLDEALAEASADDWTGRIEKLTKELSRERTKAKAALLAHELGEIVERRQKQEGAALKLYGRALQLDPTLRSNLWAIRRIFYRQALWPNLLKLVDAEIRLASTDAERADLWMEKGRIQETCLKETEAAKASYERTTFLEPRHLPALLARERLAMLERDQATLARVWRGLADAVATPARKVGYLLALAGLQAKLGDGGASRALVTIAEAKSLGVERGLIAAEQERVAMIAGNNEALLEALEDQIVDLSGTGDSTADGNPELSDGHLASSWREALALRRRQARIAVEAGDRARGFAYLEKALALDNDDPLVLGDLIEHSERSGDWDSCAEWCGKLAKLESSGRALALSLRAANALVQAGQSDRAEASYDSIVANHPGYLPVIAWREWKAIRVCDWERVATLKLAEAASARLGTVFGPDGLATGDPGWAAGAYVSAGDLLSYRLGRDEEARSAYEQALAAMPGYWPAVWALVDLHRKAGRLEEACVLLERQVEQSQAGTAGDEDRARDREALEELARLYEERGRPEDALCSVQRLVERCPDEPALRWRLEELLLICGRAEERAVLLRRLAERTTDPARAGAIHLELALAYEETLGQPQQALVEYRRALELLPNDSFIREAYAGLLRQTGRWQDLCAHRQSEADAMGGGVQAVAALHEVAAVLRRKLGRFEQAAAAYRDICDRAPDDAFAVHGLATVLADLVRSSSEANGQRGNEKQQQQQQQQEQQEQERASAAATGRSWLGALTEALEREAALVPSGQPRSQALARLAEVYESANQEEDAAAAYRRALEEGGANAIPYWALAEIASRHGDWTGVVDALGALGKAEKDGAGEAGDDDGRTSTSTSTSGRAGRQKDDLESYLLEEAAWLLMMSDPEEAATIFDSLVDGGSPRAPNGLPPVGRLAAGTHPLRRSSVTYREYAPSSLLAATPPAASSASVRQTDRCSRASVLLGICLTAARKHDNAALARALAMLSEQVGDPAAASALAMRAAVLSGVAGKREHRDYAARSLALTPDDPAAVIVATELGVPGRDADPLAWADLLGRRAAVAEDAANRAELELEQAEALERAGRLADAGRVLWRILERNHDHLGALWTLRRIAMRGGDLETVVRASFRLSRSLADNETAARLALESATILDRDLQRPKDSMPLWRAVLERTPRDSAAYARAREILSSNGDRSGLYALASFRLHHVTGSQEEIPCRLDRAKVRWQREDFERATEDLEQILRIDPRHLESLSLLAEIKLAVGEPQAAAALLERYLRSTEDAVLVVPIRKRLATVLVQIGDHEGAVAVLQKVVEVDADDLGSRAALIEALLAIGNFGRAASEIQDLGIRRGDRQLRARDELRAARLYREKLGDLVRAHKALERARQLSPLDLETVRELFDISEGAARKVVVEMAVREARRAIAAKPTDAQLFELLVSLADLGEDRQLGLAASGALMALGAAPEEKQVAYRAQQQTLLAAVPQFRKSFSETSWRDHAKHAGADPRLTDVWSSIAAAFSRLHPHEPAQLGFSKRDAVAAKALAREFPAVSALAAMAGIEDFDVYVSASRPGFVRSLALDTPVLYLGTDVARAETPEMRCALARAMSQTALRCGAFDEPGSDEVLVALAGAFVLAGCDPALLRVEGKGAGSAGSQSSSLQRDELVKMLGKAVSRKERKLLAIAAAAFSRETASEGAREVARAAPLGAVTVADGSAWCQAMRMAIMRGTLLLYGDVAAAVALAVGNQSTANISECREGVDLLCWAVGDNYLTLRVELGS
ncbi:MAG: tetratricopeptide repeat protein [Pseudomonadota bacterium]